MLCFFFKQKTAYEMRISDWSSDVCSSDLQQLLHAGAPCGMDDVRLDHQIVVEEVRGPSVVREDAADPGGGDEDGLRPRLGDPSFGLGLAPQIDDVARRRQKFAAGRGGAADKSRSEEHQSETQ